ncbi:MAG TPA: asparagine synthase C-terminal domain-containing protein, partial [Bryobacteraceae bacterium]|nr:asparagine synthase C-terminal domain-containing protein [Bryobacteraceae bacterium]
LMADVPLGAFLSGGLDSSLVTALVCRLSPGPVETFSVGYRERAFSELGYAAEVSRHLGTVHREVVIGAEEFFGELPHLIWHEDEPITWPSSVALYFVSRLASKHVKVVLTGEGGDELFAGYERYRWTLWNLRANCLYGQLPGLLRRRIRNWIQSSRLLKADLRRKLGHTFLGREARLESLYLDNFYGAFSQRELEAALGTPGGGAYENFLRYWNRRDGTALARMLYTDQKTYLVELLM